MDELTAGLLVLAASSIGTAIGYILRRYFEGAGAAERLGRMHLALEIKQKMDEGNFTPEDVERMVKNLLPRGSWQRRGSSDDPGAESFEAARLRARTSALAELAAGDPPGFGDGPQQAMNRQASERRERAEAIMSRALAELEGLVEEEPEDLKRARAVQAAWKKYRDAQVAFTSALFAGGSMRAQIESGAAVAMTIERIVEIRMDVMERSEMNADGGWPPAPAQPKLANPPQK